MENWSQENKLKNDLINYEWGSAAVNWEVNPFPDFSDGDDGADNLLLLLLFNIKVNCRFFSGRDSL